MKSVLCDINFILDIFLKREPFYTPSARLFALIEEKKLRGYLSAQSFPILFYLLSKEVKREKALRVLEKIHLVFSIAAVDEKVIGLSLASDFKDKDFEDAVRYYSAIHARADCVITRNKADFKAEGIPVMTPEEFLARSIDFIMHHESSRLPSNHGHPVTQSVLSPCSFRKKTVSSPHQDKRLTQYGKP